ncbi:UDP-glucuronosyltransferase 2B31-like isoform X2 [Perognathus longimembris pacificus]|uniref:UDP-glucuronosyltransferase 2B31-like isoform X2 n=1 Tax=Perognathus longimembris pacificus TaxID=214514 RepID=UPI0020185188|nr:UDP-glucuronosyltransferase 2B31-like isoform X2 [Perognathus longimembris pacificus]
MVSKVTTVLLLLQLSGYFVSGKCGKVLVWPMEYSHWINMKIILDELVLRGHQVTVLVSSSSAFFDVDQPSLITFEIYPSPSIREEVERLFLEAITKWIYELSELSFWTYFSRLQELVWEDSAYFESLCKDVVLNKKLMTKLGESRFDVILADAFIPCGDLLAELLSLPLVYTHRFFWGYTYEKYSGGLPVPPSYVPIIQAELSDRMTFTERVKNMLYVIYFDFWFQAFNEKKWDQFYSEVLGRPTTLSETMAKADIWLVRTYWDIEFPRPLLPNFEFVGGLHCKPAKPLPKVVWRFDGKKPDALGSNTQLSKWIPQNDLLGHPKTKAFITHGGTNGVYEAIYHGVPMVGIPLFADQSDNIVRMMAKGAAVRLNFHTMSSADLLKAVKTVITDPSYKENAMRLSRIHHDQPVKPLDRAVFWIEFVMRHKGAKHLRPAVHDLTWLQYHSLDVIGFLLACVAAVTFIFMKGCVLCCRKLAKTGKKKKRE